MYVLFMDEYAVIVSTDNEKMLLMLPKDFFKKNCFQTCLYQCVLCKENFKKYLFYLDLLVQNYFLSLMIMHIIKYDPF